MNYKRLLFSIVTFCICSFQTYCQNDTIQPVDSLKKNLIDKTLGLLEYSFDRTKISFYPSMSLDPASGLSFGMLPVISISPKEKSEFYRPTSIVNLLTYSTLHWLNLKTDVLLYTQNGNQINAYFQYVSAPDKFFGVGQTERNYNPTTFDLKEFKLKGSYTKSIANIMFAGLIIDASHIITSSLGPNEFGVDIPDQKNKFVFGIGPELSYDTRDNVNYPSKGTSITTNYLYYPQIDGGYKFQSFEFNAKHFFSIYKDLIGGVHLFSGAVHGDTPFYYLHQLGGKTRMRGISNKGLYINDNALYSQFELRKHVWDRFGLIVFGGYGNSFKTIKTIDSESSKFVYGAGIRFLTSEEDKLNLRIDYGRGSHNDSGVYLTMREAF